MIARSILITGASSGIGRALALAYAAPGVRLALLGRDASRLAAVAEAARAKGAVVEAGTVDVRDRLAMASWIEAADIFQPFDLAIANAGITTGLAPGALTEDPEAVRAILATNLVGVLNTAEPLIAPMCARGTGQLAFVGSLAGLHGLPYSPAYCVTKAGVHAYAESLRGRLEPQGVLVSLIIAGFVKTPLNDSIDAMKPGEITDAEAAALIKRGLSKGKATIAFPWFLYVLTRLGRLLPARVYDRIMAGVTVTVPGTQERIGPENI
ncbi:SDR family oxidoreductase [Beijerinckia sp. L45]|uniref:SDR family NAD(P)-dependent oxidoreductase n=1 Tax=Beijerinckia sp. L45 TaxID=1641855 RepID=UPI00131DF37E|nr:SDR family NAD(P)-dependent oxidoreductase [Beijerinckia sp. L45]